MGNRAESKELITLGNHIRERRIKLNMSQETMAEKAGISVSTVSRIEGGITAMSIEIFIKLVQILDMDAGELLGFSGISEMGGQYKDIFFRIDHLGQCEQEIVRQTMDVLVEGLHQCR